MRTSLLPLLALALGCSSAPDAAAHPPALERPRAEGPVELARDEPTEAAPDEREPSADEASGAPPASEPPVAPALDRRPRSRVEPDRACSEDADCVPAPACCPSPCTDLVVNQTAAARISAELERTCTPRHRAQCISAGGCRTHAYLCVRRQCALVYHDSPHYRARR